MLICEVASSLSSFWSSSEMCFLFAAGHDSSLSEEDCLDERSGVFGTQFGRSGGCTGGVGVFWSGVAWLWAICHHIIYEWFGSVGEYGSEDDAADCICLRLVACGRYVATSSWLTTIAET